MILVLKIWDISQDRWQKYSELIIIIVGTLEKGWQEVGVVRTNFIKRFDIKFAESDIIFTSYGGSANWIVDHAYLTKIVAYIQFAHLDVIHFAPAEWPVIYSHLAGTLRNNVHRIWISIALFNHFLIRLLKVHHRIPA